MSILLLRQSRSAAASQAARWLPAAIAPTVNDVLATSTEVFSVGAGAQAAQVGSLCAEQSRVTPSRGFAASSSAPPEASTSSEDEKPDIFELFAALEKQYEHVPWLPIEYGEEEDVESKQQRVTRERELQEQVAAARVRKVDEEGRAHGLGKRKSAVARVKLWEHSPPPELAAPQQQQEQEEEAGSIQPPIHRPRPPQTINGRPVSEYFRDIMHREIVMEPFSISGSHSLFAFDIFVRGGGASGQAQAVRLGIARALQNYNPDFRSVLRPAGLLTRDSRVVERKKPGKAKARKSFQWVKR